MDPDSGHLTGVIDWAEANTLPFECALWGMENLLGFMDADGWHYFPVHRKLEDLFWKTFQSCINNEFEEVWPAIEVTQRIGIFLRYGFCWIQGSQQRVTNECIQSFCQSFLTLLAQALSVLVTFPIPSMMCVSPFTCFQTLRASLSPVLNHFPIA